MTGHPSRSQSNVAKDALREKNGQTGSKHTHQERPPSPSATSLTPDHPGHVSPMVAGLDGAT
jgi:hypothetical protein